jgi:photosystem II stability/assembly factor-like uncharacterized protein
MMASGVGRGDGDNARGDVLVIGRSLRDSRIRRLQAVLVAAVLLGTSVASPDRGAAASARLAVSATEVLSTPKTMSNLESVSCGSPTACITASWPPQRTSDGGASWTSLRVTDGPFGDWLVDVDCLSATTCIGVSGGGSLVRTSDLGTTWSALSLPPDVFISSVSCTDEQHCAVIGSSAIQLRFLTTADGGTSWASRDLHFTGAPRKLRCGTSSFCLVTTDADVMRSADGGATWTPFPVSTHISAVECPGATVCVAAGSGILEVFGPTTHAEYATIVGTGHAVVACPTATKCVVFDFAFGISSAVMIDLQSGALGGVSLPADLGLVHASTCSAGRCIAVGESVAAGAASSAVAVTASANNPYDSWTGSANSARIERYISLACATENICIVVGTTGQQSARTLSVDLDSNGLVRRTTDGGATWSPVAVPADVRQIYSVACTTSTCIASAWSADPGERSTVIVSRDAGLTWSHTPLSMGGVNDSSVACKGSACFVVSTLVGAANSRVAVTLDGGQTWPTQTTLPGFGLLHCATATSCIATMGTTSGPQMFRTVNAGATFEAVPMPAGAFGVSILDCISDRCFAAVSTATGQDLGVTTDLGATWSRVPFNVGTPVIACAPTRCLVLRQGNTVQFAAPGDVGIDGDRGPKLALTEFSTAACPSVSRCLVLGSGGSKRGSAVVRLDVRDRAVVAVTPARLLETRSGPGVGTIDGRDQGGGPIVAGTVHSLLVRGRGGVPADAASVIVTVTATEPVGSGFVTVFPCDQPMPLASNLNFTPDQTVADMAITPIASDGTICLFASSTTHLIVDINGYVKGGTNGLVAVAPARLLESRSGPGQGTIDGRDQGVGTMGSGTVYPLLVRGRGGVAANAASAVVTVTVTEPVLPGFVTVFPCDQPMPLASNLNYVAGQTVADVAISPLAADGTICLYTSSPTQLIVDVNGYVPPAVAGLNGVAPARLLESRSGPGVGTIDGRDQGIGLRSGGSVYPLLVHGRAGVGGDAGSVVVTVTATQPLAAGFVTVYPCDQPMPLASNLNYVAGQTVADLALTPIADNGTICLYTSSTTHLIVDVNASVT